MADRSETPTEVEAPATDQKMADGKALRSEVPRASHSEWSPPADRPDPVAILEEQAAQRLPDLVPIRYGRMLVSPGTFYRIRKE